MQLFQIKMPPPVRCCNDLHLAIQHLSPGTSEMWQTVSKHVETCVLDYFGLEREKSKYICKACITFASEQTKGTSGCSAQVCSYNIIDLWRNMPNIIDLWRNVPDTLHTIRDRL